MIGHEITHGFDDQGRKFDADGTLTRLVDRRGRREVQRPGRAAFGKQYSAFEVLPGAHINGDLTMGENIADLAACCWRWTPTTLSLEGKPAPVIDGLTGDQRFFLGFAQIWRAKLRDDALKQQIASDEHSPANFRALWHGAQHGRLVRRLRGEGRRRHVREAGRPRPHLVEGRRPRTTMERGGSQGPPRFRMPACSSNS